ncbi:PREDICTED: protein NEDD1 [Nicotiana attenuata]|uniref:Protein nedd1 n=1 Tax=Nicotiana attenuata TaxID=49451 RepID=A0A314KW69_NICAT|nr:PREDICTED: protein NEDD1 [Nicotiana attenuata]OIT33425.1 protein nedd1 [Nicotiana attenuata]
MDSIKSLLAASGADTVKLFDLSLEPRDPCILSYTPSPGFLVNSLKWNFTNLVVASAGDDKKISLWRKNGQSLGTLPTDAGDNIEESISTINFSSKASRYICSGGSGQVVRIWDLQRKRCIKWLKGHTDTISGVMYNCKDEHLASISLNGNLILHNLASGAKAAELKDPNEQVLRVLDYSKISRHLLVTAGDDGSIHLWDTTGRIPKVSWLKQHSAPTSGISFSPSNDKIVASVGMDKKLYTFDSGSRRPSFCIPYEAPFSSLAFTDDGFTLAAGTSSGRVVFYDVRGKPQPLTVLRAYGTSEAVTSLCWQRAKPVMVNENNCTTEIALLGSAVEDSILMPDPLPATTSSSLSTSMTTSGSRTTVRSGSVDSFSFPAGNTGSTSGTLGLSPSEETPIRSSLWKGGSLTRLHAPRNFKDDMEVFSPLNEVQPITPSLDKFWDDQEGFKKDLDKRSSLLFPSLRFPLPVEGGNDNRPIFDWKSSSLPKQEDTSSVQLSSTPTSFRSDDSSSITPPEAWGGERLSDRLSHLRHSGNMPSRFATSTSGPLAPGTMFSGLQDTFPATQSISSLSNSSLSLANLRIKENSNEETSLGSPENIPSSSTSFSVGTKGITGQGTVDSLGSTMTLPRRFSSYAERISTKPSFSDGTLSVGSPKTKKTGAETRGELLNSLLSRSDTSSATAAGAFQAMNGEVRQSQTSTLPELQQGSSFQLQLFERKQEETLSFIQRTVHEQMRNLHLELISQNHMLQMEMSSRYNLILDNQKVLFDRQTLILENLAELMKRFN